MRVVAAKPAYVLLVERQLRLRGAIRDVIVSEPGFELIAACASKQAALQVIEAKPLDIVLVSLDLVDGTGLDVIRAARKSQPLCEVLVMVAAEEWEDIFASMQAGASGCLLKESIMHRERVHGSPIVGSRVFSRVLEGLPARGETGIPRKSGYRDCLPCNERFCAALPAD